MCQSQPFLQGYRLANGYENVLNFAFSEVGRHEILDIQKEYFNMKYLHNVLSSSYPFTIFHTNSWSLPAKFHITFAVNFFFR